MIPVLNRTPSSGTSASYTIDNGTIIIKNTSTNSIILNINDITRNDQKFFAEVLKNSPAENFPGVSFKPLNNPPERKALRRKVDDK